MTGRGRRGRVLAGRVVVEKSRNQGRCPICQAAPGWRCTKTVAGVQVPRKANHEERREK